MKYSSPILTFIIGAYWVSSVNEKSGFHDALLLAILWAALMIAISIKASEP